MICKRCGETNNFNILTGECYNCGANKGNNPLIRDIKLSSDLTFRVKTIDGELSVYVLNEEGEVIAKGWK